MEMYFKIYVEPFGNNNAVNKLSYFIEKICFFLITNVTISGIQKQNYNYNAIMAMLV